MLEKALICSANLLTELFFTRKLEQSGMHIHLSRIFRTDTISSLLLTILFSLTFGFCSGQIQYDHFIDSADLYLDDDPERAISILKSIPKPLEVSLKGNVAEYYESLAFAYYQKDDIGLAHRYMLIGAKQAEKEKKYKLAGGLYTELFTLNQQFEDKPNKWFLEKAIENFEIIDDDYGLLEVVQARSCDYFLKEEYQKCIDLGIENQSRFRKADANDIELVNHYMISSSYIRINDIQNGLKFYEYVRSSRNKKDIDEDDYLFYLAVLDYDLSNYYFEQKNADSAIYFLQKVVRKKKHLDYSMDRNYYLLGIDVYRLAGMEKETNAYLDSLLDYDNRLNESLLVTNQDANEKLASTQDNLTELQSETEWITMWLVILGVFILVLLVFLYRYRKKVKTAALNLNEKMEESFSGKKKQQKLSAKINQLEGHIADIKTEVKNITNEDVDRNQQDKLRRLYMEINVKSNLMSDQDHLLVVNELNEEFFKRLESVHPDLNESELAICYYLFLGFKNKEIASFRNSTVRAIESKRFRLTKKINSNGTVDKLIPHLNSIMEGLEL